MRLATVLAAISTLLLTISTAEAQNFCVTGFTLPINLPSIPNTKMQVPFTAIVKLTFDQQLADGNAIHGEVHYHIARDASGTVMNEMPSGCILGDDGQMHQIFHVTVRSGNTIEEWTLGDDPIRKIATIIHFSDPVKPSEAELAAIRARAGSRPPQTNQWQTESLGTREFQGISARGTRRTQTIPPGQQGNALQLVITNETWLSPQFGNMMAISDDPRRGRSTAELVELRQAAPDPSLFSPPKDYIVKAQPAQPPATIVSAPTMPQ